jgi:hypothetical protein
MQAPKVALGTVAWMKRPTVIALIALIAAAAGLLVGRATHSSSEASPATRICAEAGLAMTRNVDDYLPGTDVWDQNWAAYSRGQAEDWAAVREMARAAGLPTLAQAARRLADQWALAASSEEGGGEPDDRARARARELEVALLDSCRSFGAML